MYFSFLQIDIFNFYPNLSSYFCQKCKTFKELILKNFETRWSINDSPRQRYPRDKTALCPSNCLSLAKICISGLNYYLWHNKDQYLKPWKIKGDRWSGNAFTCILSLHVGFHGALFKMSLDIQLIWIKTTEKN